MKRMIASILILVLLASGLSGCGKPGNISVSDSGKKVIFCQKSNKILRNIYLLVSRLLQSALFSGIMLR